MIQLIGFFMLGISFLTSIELLLRGAVLTSIIGMIFVYLSYILIIGE